MKVHHIGYAVEDILAASKTFAAMGFSILSGICRDNDRNVDIMLLRNGATTIELVAPTTVGSKYWNLAAPAATIFVIRLKTWRR